MADYNNTTANILITGTSEADSVYNASVASNVTIETYEGNDIIKNYGESVTIIAGEGNNTIQNGEVGGGTYGRYSYIMAGSGDDSITNRARYVTIDAGAGNDYVYTDIRGDSYQDVTVYGGEGNDTLVVMDHQCSLNGGAGDDYISVLGSIWNGNTLEGGTGNDTLYGGGNNVFYYQEGDGHDIIYNYTTSDKIQINSNTPYSSVQSGSDVLITIGDGSILLKNSTLAEVDIYYADSVGFGDINVDLNNVGENTGGVFIVNEVTNADGTVSVSSVATFKTAAEEGDIVVGDVTADKVYTARSDTAYAQNITVAENWNVTATNNNDYLNITGNNATVAGSAGNDRFYVSSGVNNATFGDFTPSEDSLSFASQIPENSLYQSMIENALVLSNDNINLTFKNTPNLTTELAGTTVSNGGVTNTISELIAGATISDIVVDPDAPVMMSLSHWSYGFYPPTE